jgi:large subunit ribosomal protein L30
VAGKKLRIKLVGSMIGLSPRQEATVKALGLRRMNHEVVQEDTATIRGMIATAPHVLEVIDEA